MDLDLRSGAIILLIFTLLIMIFEKLEVEGIITNEPASMNLVHVFSIYIVGLFASVLVVKYLGVELEDDP